MKSFVTVSIEAAVVGILLILFVYLSRNILIMAGWPIKDLPLVCQNWNDTNIMEATLFTAGFLFHMVFEYSGLNKMYVDNYYS